MIEYKDMKLLEAFKYIPTRAVNLLNKMLGLKGIAIASTMYLIHNSLIPDPAIGYVWVLVILIVVFGEKALTLIKDIKK